LRLTFRAHERLRRPADFARARRQGSKRVGRHLVVWCFRRAETPPRATRLGLVVGRRHGGAVQRNLFKRRLRETFRQNKERWPRGLDVVVSPKATGAADFPPGFDALKSDLLSLVPSR